MCDEEGRSGNVCARPYPAPLDGAAEDLLESTQVTEENGPVSHDGIFQTTIWSGVTCRQT